MIANAGSPILILSIAIGFQASKTFAGAWIRPLLNFPKDSNSGDFGTIVASSIHAIGSCTLAFYILFIESNAIREDRISGSSPASDAMIAFSTAYFLWDVTSVLSEYPKIDYAFLLHGVACFLCYFLASNPKPFFPLSWSCISVIRALDPFLEPAHAFENDEYGEDYHVRSQRALLCLRFRLRSDLGWDSFEFALCFA